MCLLPVAGQLPASKTHAARRWSFLPAADATQPALGVLTLVQGRSDIESYSVALEDGQVLFVKLADGEVYGVSLDRGGKPARCTCKGWCFTKKCKHKDAVSEMLADGVLQLPAAPAPRPSLADLDAF